LAVLSYEEDSKGTKAMNPESKSPANKRNVGFTERDRTLLLLLREIPFMTLKDIKAFLYPNNAFKTYAKEKTRYLLKEGLLSKSFLENGKCIYYLTQAGVETATYILRDAPRFHPESSSFYFRRPPAQPGEEKAFFLFPTPDIEFRFFTPEKSSSFQFYHSQALLELYFQLHKSRRFSSILWLDKVRNKKDAVDIDCNPDFLLTNDVRTSEGRVLIELENSLIREHNLVPKLDNLCRQQADFYLLLCTNEDIFRNLGLKIRTVLSGKAKESRDRVLFRPQTLAALTQTLWIGLWKPALHNRGETMRLKDLVLYRYDHEIFDAYGWTDHTDGGAAVVDSKSGKVKRVMRKIGYSHRRPGKQTLSFPDLLNQYTEAFKKALSPIFEAETSRKAG